jgi:hypothetical protein
MILYISGPLGGSSAAGATRKVFRSDQLVWKYTQRYSSTIAWQELGRLQTFRSGSGASLKQSLS